MPTVTLAEAQSKLPELIDRLTPGEELVITRDDRTVAKLVSPTASGLPPRRAGSGKGQLVVVSEDDEHLDDFAEYL